MYQNPEPPGDVNKFIKLAADRHSVETETLGEAIKETMREHFLLKDGTNNWALINRDNSNLQVTKFDEEQIWKCESCSRVHLQQSLEICTAASCLKKANGSELVQISNQTPIIKDNYPQVLSAETAYQITSFLQGVVERGTGKKLRKLGLNIAGKTGTTNENTDAWFIGFTSNLVIGVYVGMDNPKPLGKFETGSKAALPIFKDFVKNALFKEDFKEFKIPKGIYLTSLNYDTGLKASIGKKNTIIEALTEKDINNIDNNELISVNSYDKLIKYRQFY